VAEQTIAILTSTKPLRVRMMEGGREVEKLDPSRLMMLSDAFKLIIIGSRAHEDFYARMKRALSRKVKKKFVFYSRGFFDRFTHTQDMAGPVNDRDEGWKEILRTHGINFVGELAVQLDAMHQGTKAFRWTEIELFIQDPRVSVVGAEFFRPRTR